MARKRTVSLAKINKKKKEVQAELDELQVELKRLTQILARDIAGFNVERSKLVEKIRDREEDDESFLGELAGVPDRLSLRINKNQDKIKSIKKRISLLLKVRIALTKAEAKATKSRTKSVKVPESSIIIESIFGDL